MTKPTRDPLRLWADSIVPVEDAHRAEAREQAGVERVRSALREVRSNRERVRRNRKWVAFSAAAAIVLAGAGLLNRTHGKSSASSVEPSNAERIGSFLLSSGSARRVHHGETFVASGGALRVEVGDEIATIGAGEGSLELVSGVAMGLGSDTLVRLATAPASEVSVDAGNVSVKVPKLPQGQTFAVRTPNALVSVHGTEFSVGVQGAAVGSVSTHVVVTSGVVTVKCDDGKNATLTAGQEEVCALQVAPEQPSVAAPAGEPSPTSDGAESISAGSKVRTEGAARSLQSRIAAPVERDGLLGEQNRLLASAMDARKRGDDQSAIRILDDFLAKYPSSPVVEVAHVERFRALERAGNHAEAAKEARRYLATYRDGFAREEARKLAVDRL
jgi:hypothetical protein